MAAVAHHGEVPALVVADAERAGARLSVPLAVDMFTSGENFDLA
jgi:hypothetical protein